MVLTSCCSNKTQGNISVRVKAVSDHWSCHGWNGIFLSKKGFVISLAYGGAYHAIFQGGSEYLSSLTKNWQVLRPSNMMCVFWVAQMVEDLQDLLELTPKKEVLFIIRDWNAKVGSQETPGVTGKSGLGILIRVLPRKCIGSSKHPLPTTQEKTLHMDITSWSTTKSD